MGCALAESHDRSFFAWAAARVIEGVVQARKTRSQTLAGLRGALNFCVRITSDLLPDLYAWRLRDLDDELRWLHLRLNRSVSLRTDERLRAEALERVFREALEAANRARRLRRESENCKRIARDTWNAERDSHPTRLSPYFQQRWLTHLEEERLEYLSDPEPAAASLLVTLSVAKEQSSALDAPDEVKSAVADFLIAIELEIEACERLRSLCATIIHEVRDGELVLLDRMA